MSGYHWKQKGGSSIGGEDSDWRQSGLCTQIGDPDMFTADDGRSTVGAKKICQRCPVMERCRNFALDNGVEFGIFGGLGPQERRKILRQRRIDNGTARKK